MLRRRTRTLPILLQGFKRVSSSHERLTPPVTPPPQPRAGVRAALARPRCAGPTALRWPDTARARVRQVLKFYGLDGQSKWLNLLYETFFLFGFVFLAWVGLAFQRHVRR